MVVCVCGGGGVRYVSQYAYRKYSFLLTPFLSPQSNLYTSPLLSTVFFTPCALPSDLSLFKWLRILRPLYTSARFRIEIQNVNYNSSLVYTRSVQICLYCLIFLFNLYIHVLYLRSSHYNFLNPPPREQEIIFCFQLWTLSIHSISAVFA